MSIENTIEVAGNSDNEKFLEFKKIVLGKDYDVCSYEKRFEAVKNFEKYDCPESRNLLKYEVAKRDESPHVRQLAYNTCAKLKLKQDPYRAPRKIIYHPKYYMMAQRIQELFRKHDITSTEQIEGKKYEAFLSDLKQYTPKYYDIIKGHYGFGLEKELQGFFKKQFNKITNEPRVLARKGRSKKPTIISDL